MYLAKGKDWGGILDGPWKDWGESLQALIQQSIDGFAIASWEFLKGAFGVGSFTADGGGSDWWLAVIGGKIEVYQGGVYQHTVEYPGMLNVMVIAMVPLLIIFLSIQIFMSIYRASTAGMIRAFASAVLAVPATYICAGIVYLGLIGTDQLTQWILEVGVGDTSGDDVGVGGILRLFGLWWDPSANNNAGGVQVDAGFEIWAMANGTDQVGQSILPWLVAGVILISCLILMLMMLFRTVIVLVLAMFTPVGVFSMSWDAAKGIASKWASLVVALLMAKPIAAAVTKFGITMASIGSDWVQMAAGVVLVLISAAMPIVMISIISFMTPDSARMLEQTAGGFAMAGQRRVYGGIGRGGQRVMRSSTSAVRKSFGGASRAGRRLFTGRR
ncbi:type IV secretion system protein [Brevibacterium sediminis]|uniref:type IV secretion system protein n=1 Tax=Brevibacterium sediminis TaxID=1857024 RepID=UPI0021756068|nr:type IV secretion system protein [Brevibacterium sediminis]MCS4592657.1 type IV secretion system protein [Brevibacterium sediminis]